MGLHLRRLGETSRGRHGTPRKLLISAKRGRERGCIGAAFQQPWGVENEGEERAKVSLYRHMERV